MCFFFVLLDLAQDPAVQYLLRPLQIRKTVFLNLEHVFTFFWKLNRHPPRLTSTKAMPVTCSGATLLLRPSSTPAALTNRIKAKKKERKKKVLPQRLSSHMLTCRRAVSTHLPPAASLACYSLFSFSSSSPARVAAGDGGWMSVRRETPDDSRTVGRVTEQQQQ